MCSNKNVQCLALWHSEMVGRYSYRGFSRESLCTYKDISHWRGNSPCPKWKKFLRSCLYGKYIAWVIVSRRRWTSCRAGDKNVSCLSYSTMICKLPPFPFFFLESSPPPHTHTPWKMKSSQASQAIKQMQKELLWLKLVRVLYTPWDRQRDAKENSKVLEMQPALGRLCLPAAFSPNV